MNKAQRVEFRTFDQVTLRGDLFRPQQSNAPIVIMTQGLTLLKEHFINGFAPRFQAAGLAVLIYDHRGYGSSEGEPRHETDPWQQALDYSDAVTFASTLGPEVDASKICVWGVGHSGGASMLAASADPRIAAVVLLMPFTSGARDAANFPPGLLDRAWTERAASAKAGPSGKAAAQVTVWPESDGLPASPDGAAPLLSGDDIKAFSAGAARRSAAAGTPWANVLSLQSFLHISRVEPAAHIGRIAPRPLLYLAATTDALTGPLHLHRAVFDSAGSPKEFVTLDNNHLATYMHQNDAFEKSVGAQIAFLNTHLRAAPA